MYSSLPPSYPAHVQRILRRRRHGNLPRSSVRGCESGSGDVMLLAAPAHEGCSNLERGGGHRQCVLCVCRVRGSSRVMQTTAPLQYLLYLLLQTLQIRSHWSNSSPKKKNSVNIFQHLLTLMSLQTLHVVILSACTGKGEFLKESSFFKGTLKYSAHWFFILRA